MIKPEVLDAMVAAGCTAEQIVAAVKAEAQADDARVARKREADAARKRRQRETERSNVTLSHADICGQAVTAQDGPSPKKETSPTPPKEKTTPSSTEPNGSSKTRAARLSADWVLPDDWRQDAIKAGLPSDRIAIEAEKMRDWSISSPNGAKREWRAAWRNWVKGAAEKLPKGRGGTPQRPKPRGSDFFDMEAQERTNGRAADGRSDQGNRDDAPGVPVIAIEHYRRNA